MPHRGSASRPGQRLVHCLFVVLALCSARAHGQAAGQQARPDSTRPAAVAPAAQLYPPSPFPDRIILTVTADPARSMGVTWRTDASVAYGLVQIAPADHGPQFEATATTLRAQTTPLLTTGGAARAHGLALANLSPGTKYLYRVGDETHWSEWATFQTASAGTEPFRFLFLGDAQTNIKSHWSRVIRAAFAAAPDARFVVHAGDLVNRGAEDREWGEWFHAAGWINTMIPSLPSPGNHDYVKPADPKAPGAVSTLTTHWRSQFTLPENGPAGLAETAYYTDYQGVRIISLNSNEGHEAQAKWLHQILRKNPSRWTIVTFHHPIYSSAKERDNPRLRKLWQPVFDLYHVDLVLQGHDHTYSRTGVQIASAEDLGTSATSPERGAVYVNSVAGPKQYVLDRRPEQKRTAEGTQLFQIISINGNRLHLEARTAVGELYDAFTLTKRPAQPNELTEEGPGTPERHPTAPAARQEARASAALRVVPAVGAQRVPNR